MLPPYAELRCLSNFSFLRGASRPEELVERAQALGYSALGMTDECTLAGIVRAHVQAKASGLKLLVGSQFEVAHQADQNSTDKKRCDFGSSFNLVVLARNLNGYGNLCEFITALRRATKKKGSYSLKREHIQGRDLADCLVVVTPGRASTPEQLLTLGHWVLTHFYGPCWFGVEHFRSLASRRSATPDFRQPDRLALLSSLPLRWEIVRMLYIAGSSTL